MLILRIPYIASRGQGIGSITQGPTRGRLTIGTEVTTGQPVVVEGVHSFRGCDRLAKQRAQLLRRGSPRIAEVDLVMLAA